MGATGPSCPTWPTQECSERGSRSRAAALPDRGVHLLRALVRGPARAVGALGDERPVWEAAPDGGAGVADGVPRGHGAALRPALRARRAARAPRVGERSAGARVGRVVAPLGGRRRERERALPARLAAGAGD